MMLTRSLVLRALCAFSSFNGVLAAPAVAKDEIAPRAAIAVKLNSSASRARSVAGADIVEDLVRKALPNSGHSKREAQFNVLPLITTLTPDQISEMIERATKLTPSYKPGDFSSWFQVQFPQYADDEENPEITQLLSKLAVYQDVASVQHLGIRTKAPAIQPNDDPLFADQGYLTGDGVGIDAVYAWDFPGGDGAGTTFIDIERGWKLTHEDLVDKNITLLYGQNVQDRYGGNWPHGTAVLGELFMTDNTIGGVGIAPAAEAHVVGITRTVGGVPVENEPEAILDAANYLAPGDVMLLEMQTGDANGDLWPVEILDAQFDAISLATALGIIVIEPAANGGMDMDQPVLRPGDTTAVAILNRSSPEFRDSGAVVVGAGSAALPRSRLPFSNYGSRVDVHSWGEGITTSSVVTSDFSNDDTYDEFSGTSGASPIVAGAALSIQGMVQANRGARLTPAEMRNLLTVGGTPSADPAADKIGVQPDLRALIDGGYLE
ncbi:hypothetical protein VTI28DRAFT_9672 [Corynascus sepedonium]